MYLKPMKAFHRVYDVKSERLDPSIEIHFPPLIAEQDVNEREANDKVDIESLLSPLIYNPPPDPETLHNVKLRDEKLKV